MRIFLIGFMGCGKTTLGRQLAQATGLSFIDLDHHIEEKYHKTVPEIFAEYGEEEFRKMEKEALHEVGHFENVIISTGGGAPCFFDNMDFMNKQGETLYMKLPVEVLADRLINARVERPLAKGKTEEELIDFISETLKKRDEFYMKAKWITNPADYPLQKFIDYWQLPVVTK